MTDPTLERGPLVVALGEEWDALAALVADLDESAWRTPSPLPGWTVFDVLAHVVGTESWLLGEKPPALGEGVEKVDVRTLPHVRNETAALNEIWVQRLRPLTGAQLLQRFREVTGRRRTVLAAMGDAEWAAETPSPIGQVAYGRFMRVRLFDCWMHELDIADALGRTVDEGAPRARLAFTELAGSIPRVVVKRGGAPRDSRITFDLTGPLARELHIEVDERAAYVAAHTAPATVEITLDAGLFARLGGGRTTAAEHSGEITCVGDTALGRRVIENLAFTI
ncbi:maleylpyruvate isomerase family mycothiol-dependent enzyme [Nocardia panacis]|uniref:Maleylpyruvate isomerase family mycothiol-dependent enzyme n=1 Tax=Nocardia panacis TaxID=2340916 RepID=A0A3A4KHI7_9NOCA|nr:maleylpyruvate isomerase family mycothiol-dependent enzyme [Nocardia panacis]RJO72300.1 maleylpyruvate isomerase family mycothiol-dependent enzyme [Nocardia panacis]